MIKVNEKFIDQTMDPNTGITIGKYFWGNDEEPISLNFPLSEMLENVAKWHIPFFQRKYNWKDENIIELINDIIETDSGYFVGQIILQKVKNSTNEYQVIDGQQRITTLMMILDTLHESYPNDLSNFKINEKIYQDNKGVIFSKLKYSSTGNHVVFKDLVQYNNTKSNVKKMLENHNIKPSELYSKIMSVTFNINKFPHETNENKLFEKINSTGMDLSVSDLLRNFLLMRFKDGDEGEDVNEEYIDNFFSNEIEKLISSKDLMPYSEKQGRFYKTFISYYAGEIVDEQKDKRLYGVLKRRFLSKGETVGNFIKELNSFAIFSKKVHTLSTIDKSSPACSSVKFAISTIYKKNTTSLLPILYHIEKKTGIDILSYDDIKFHDFIALLAFKNSILHLSESKESKTKLNSQKLQKIDGSLDIEGIYNYCKNNFAVTKSDIEKYIKFIMNVEDPIYGEEKSIYDFKDHYKMLMLSINNILANNANEKIKLSEIKSYSIEHIIPQNWESNNKWNAYLSNIRSDSNEVKKQICNFMLISKDISGNNWLDKKMENYQQEYSYIGKRFYNILNDQQTDWNRLGQDEIPIALNEFNDTLRIIFEEHERMLISVKNKITGA